jgi:Kef-type K+ transport system membrane component KefB
MVGAKSIFPDITVLDPELCLFFCQVALILAMCRLLSMVGQYFRQPSVVFEIIGGILLGPSALGRNLDYAHAMFPHKSLHVLEVIANYGLQLYLFLVGMELDLGVLRAHGKTTAIIALVGMAVPFGIGFALSAFLYTKYAPEDADGEKQSFATFAVFIGTAMAVTALPVLARILKDQKIMYTAPGFIALGAAVVTDALAWILLVVAISLANASNSAIAGWTFLAIALYALFVLTIGRIVLRKLVRFVEKWSDDDSVVNNLLTLVIVLMFLSAALVGQLGIDPIVGSFILGCAIPRNTKLFKVCEHTLENVVITLMLPLFFAISGLRTDVTVLTANDIPVLILVCACATFSKMFGAGFSALACGVDKRESMVLAILMNTRGLVELIVLNIGKSFNVLDERIFSILVLMCLFTTFITCPLLQLVYPPEMRKEVKNLEVVAQRLRRLSDVDPADIAGLEVDDKEIPDLLHHAEDTNSDASDKEKVDETSGTAYAVVKQDDTKENGEVEMV